MKKMTLLAIAALAMLAAPAASAQDFLDLPGMGAASDLGSAEIATDEEATPQVNQAAVTSEASAADATSEQAPVDPELAETVTSLPGGGSLPAFDHIEVGVASARGEAAGGPSTGAMVLVLLAGLGSLSSVGWLVSLRRQGVV